MQVRFEQVTAVTMDPAEPILHDAWVLVEDGKIAGFGTDSTGILPEFTGTRIDGRHKVLMPGLTNAHTHLPMTLLRGIADDCALGEWLEEHIFPAEAKFTRETVRVGCDLQIAEMIASGTSSVSDMYDFCDVLADRITQAGVKANLARGLVCPDPDFRFFEMKGVREMQALAETWHGYDGGRIKAEVGIHAEYTSVPRFWREASEYARKHGLGIHLHLSETKGEHDRCVETYGETPTALFDRYGVFESPTLAAHCVWVTEEDIAILSQRGVRVAYNPVSNMKLACGIAPVRKILNAGIHVGLGTDGMASNNSADLFEEMKAAALCQKVAALDSTAFRAWDALHMVTVGGAILQGRAEERGKIRVGFDADLILIDVDRPHLLPENNLLSNLVYSARGSDVVMNMVRGRILYKDGEFFTIDIERVKADARKTAGLFAR